MYENIPSDFQEFIQISIDLNLKTHLFRQYISTLGHINNQLKIGTIGDVIPVIDNNKIYFYAFMAETSNQSPLYSTVYETLINLRKSCEINNVQRLAIPKIMSNLNFDIIRSMIRYIFKNSNIIIHIYLGISLSSEDKVNLIKEQHVTQVGGHQGVSKTTKRLKHGLIGRD